MCMSIGVYTLVVLTAKAVVTVAIIPILEVEGECAQEVCFRCQNNLVGCLLKAFGHSPTSSPMSSWASSSWETFTCFTFFKHVFLTGHICTANITVSAIILHKTCYGNKPNAQAKALLIVSTPWPCSLRLWWDCFDKRIPPCSKGSHLPPSSLVDHLWKSRPVLLILQHQFLSIYTLWRLWLMSLWKFWQFPAMTFNPRKQAFQ